MAAGDDMKSGGLSTGAAEINNPLMVMVVPIRQRTDKQESNAPGAHKPAKGGRSFTRLWRAVFSIWFYLSTAVPDHFLEKSPSPLLFHNL